MSSRPRHCLSFSFCSRVHISGSSWAKLSWPVHGRSSFVEWVAAWDCCPRKLSRSGTLWHRGCVRETQISTQSKTFKDNREKRSMEKNKAIPPHILNSGLNSLQVFCLGVFVFSTMTITICFYLYLLQTCSLSKDLRQFWTQFIAIQSTVVKN